MKTFSHLWHHLAEFFLEWEMFQIELVEKIEIHVLCLATFFPRNACRLWDVRKRGGDCRRWYGGALHAGLVRLHACNTPPPSAPLHKHTHTLTHALARTHKGVTLVAFHSNKVFVNAPHCYVTRTLPVLLKIIFMLSFHLCLRCIGSCFLSSGLLNTLSLSLSVSLAISCSFPSLWFYYPTCPSPSQCPSNQRPVFAASRLLELRVRILPIPVAEWYKTRVCGPSLAEVAVSNPAGGMDACFVCCRELSDIREYKGR